MNLIELFATVDIASAVSTLHNLIVLSLEPLNNKPLSRTAKLSTELVCPTNVLIKIPDVTFQILILKKCIYLLIYLFIKLARKSYVFSFEALTNNPLFKTIKSTTVLL